MKIRSIGRQLPNLISLLNMLLGVTVVFMHICHFGGSRRLLACLFVLAASFLDAIDGKVARLLRLESDMGRQLDSFADFVSFGLAPMVILLTHESLRQGGWPVYACALLYCAAGAFRLARFNIGDYKAYFIGLPITAAGFIMTLLNLLLHFMALSGRGLPLILVAAFVCLIAVLMASEIKVPRPF